MAIVGVLETQVRASTQDFERGMDRAGKSARGFERNVGEAAQKAARGFGAAMTAVAASSAAAEKNWVTLGATIISSFAMGGPVVGAITAAAAAVGLFIGNSKEAATEWSKATERMRADTLKLADELQDAQKRLFILGGGTGTQFRIGLLDERLRGLRQALMPVEPTGGGREEFGPIHDVVEVRKQIAELEKQRAELVRLAELEARAQKVTADNAEREADAKSRTRAIEGGSGLLPGFGFRTREEAARALGGTRGGFTPGPPGFGTGTLTGSWDLREGSGSVESTVLVIDELAEDRARLEALAERIAEPFHSAFASAVVDGFRTGFKNLRDIGEDLVSNWLGMLARAASQRFFGGMFESIAGAAGGSVLQVLPVAVPGDVVNAGIMANGGLQSTIHVIGSDVRTLEEYRGG